MSESEGERDRTRRGFFARLSALGLAAAGGAAGVRAAGAGEEGKGVPAETIAQAERLVGLEFTPAERDLMQGALVEQRDAYLKLRAVPLGNAVPPALRFDPRPPGQRPAGAAGEPAEPAVARWSRAPVDRVPDDAEELAFLPVTQQSQLLASGKLSSLALTRLYLERLRRFDPLLRAVVTLTEDRALEQARQADREIAAGRHRGLLHGIPWGAKDLLAVRGYPTTWGSTPYREQAIEEDASVVRRLEAAGAVLVAKLSLGALAWGDVWFGGQTCSPFDLRLGSSGSSAGSAAAVAAGLVGFAIGSETWGSIVSPATRCGATGLRPSFGRVSRHGAMALSWSMDKIGPICRSVEDCAAVFDAIHGADGLDPSAVDLPFRFDADLDLGGLRVGYVQALFAGPAEDGDDEARALDLAALEDLRALGLTLQPIELPELPVAALGFLLTAEAAAAFDDLTRSGRDDLMERQVEQAWPNYFRAARLIPAVEYIQANRVRTLLLRDLERRLADVDLYVAPSFGGDNLLLTNLTGHPAVVVPSGFRRDGTPWSISFTGRLDGEATLLAVARRYQEATGHHRRRPRLAAGEGG